MKEEEQQLLQEIKQKSGGGILGDYSIMRGKVWNVFTHDALEAKSKEICKIHISVDGNKISEMHDCLIPILLKSGIKEFKVMHVEGNKIVSEDSSGSNAVGKEITIYVHDNDKDANFWRKLLGEIEGTLKANNIKPGKPSNGDLPFPGSKGYTYIRDGLNVLGLYVLAEKLKIYGFTRSESAKIGRGLQSFFGDIDLPSKNEAKASGGNLTNIDIDQSIVDKIKQEINPEKVELIRKQYCTKSTKYIHDSTDYMGLKFIVCGNRGDIDLRPQNYQGDNRDNVDIASILFDERNKFINGNSCRFDEILAPALNEAARVTASLREALNVQDNIEIGKITPALYYHFIVPFVDRAKTFSAEIIKQKIENGPDADDMIDKDNLVRQIVMCSLRDTSKNQLEGDVPQYIQGLTPEQVEKYVDIAMQRVSAITKQTQTSEPAIELDFPRDSDPQLTAPNGNHGNLENESKQQTENRVEALVDLIIPLKKQGNSKKVGRVQVSAFVKNADEIREKFRNSLIRAINQNDEIKIAINGLDGEKLENWAGQVLSAVAAIEFADTNKNQKGMKFTRNLSQKDGAKFRERFCDFVTMVLSCIYAGSYKPYENWKESRITGLVVEENKFKAFIDNLSEDEGAKKLNAKLTELAKNSKSL